MRKVQSFLLYKELYYVQGEMSGHETPFFFSRKCKLFSEIFKVTIAPMDLNIVGIGALIGAFATWYYYDQRKVLKRKRVQPKPQPMPYTHTDSFTDDHSPHLQAAHPGSLMGPYVVEVIQDNDAFFIPSELTDVKEETMSLREWSTGKSPLHGELIRGGQPLTSAIPWVKERSHVAAEAFLKGEGLMSGESEANAKYFQLWPEPKQHPYQ